MYQPEQPVFDQAIESNIEITYGIEDVPKPWWKSLYFAVQITLVDFTPFVWGGMFVSLAGLDAATVLPTMISACFLVMGICTLIQTTIGNRLPIVQGPSASLASSMGSVAATYGLPAVWGSVIVGGALETLLGGARIMSKIRKFLPPVVVGSVVAAIGYVAARIAVQWTFSSQDAKSLIMAAVAFLLALVLKFRGGKGLLSQGFILITVIIVGVVGASALGVFNWEAVHNAPWFALPKLFPYTGRKVRAVPPSPLLVPQSSAVSPVMSLPCLNPLATMPLPALPAMKSTASSTSTAESLLKAWAA